MYDEIPSGVCLVVCDERLVRELWSWFLSDQGSFVRIVQATRETALVVIRQTEFRAIVVVGATDDFVAQVDRKVSTDTTVLSLADHISEAPTDLLNALRSRRALTDTDERLSPRQREVIALAAEGLTNSQIATRLSISSGTVKRHLSDAFERLKATSRIDAVNQARRLGQISESVPSPRRVTV